MLNSKLSFRKRFVDGMIFSIISCSLLAINLYRNWQLSGTLTGNRLPSLTPLITNIHHVGVVFSNWLPFANGNYAITIVLTIGMIAILIMICLKQFLKYRRVSNYESIAAFFALFYVSFMIVTATLSRFETLNSRFISPAFIFLLWSGSSWLVPFLQRAKVPARPDRRHRGASRPEPGASRQVAGRARPGGARRASGSRWARPARPG